MTSIRVEPDSGPPVDLLEGGSQVTDAERPETILPIVIAKLRRANRESPARPISLAITHCEEALNWLHALERSKAR